jgi:hypothetical protein
MRSSRRFLRSKPIVASFASRHYAATSLFVTRVSFWRRTARNLNLLTRHAVAICLRFRVAFLRTQSVRAAPRGVAARVLAQRQVADWLA